MIESLPSLGLPMKKPCVLATFHAYERDLPHAPLTALQRRTFPALKTLRTVAAAGIGGSTGGKAGWLADQWTQTGHLHPIATAFFPLTQPHVSVTPTFTMIGAAMAAVAYSHPDLSLIAERARHVETWTLNHLQNTASQVKRLITG